MSSSSEVITIPYQRKAMHSIYKRPVPTTVSLKIGMNCFACKCTKNHELMNKEGISKCLIS